MKHTHFIHIVYIKPS